MTPASVSSSRPDLPLDGQLGVEILPIANDAHHGCRQSVPRGERATEACGFKARRRRGGNALRSPDEFLQDTKEHVREAPSDPGRRGAMSRAVRGGR
jgi:hypothetical protein